MTDRWDDLGEWLGPRLGATGKVQARGLGGPAAVGYSAETAVFSAAYDTSGGPIERRLVLRSEVSDPPIYPRQTAGIDIDIEIQHRVMEAVRHASDVPVAPILGYERDRSVIGTPFFVMDFVEGDVPTVDPSYASAGFFAEAEPQERTKMITSGLERMADVHRIDWRSAGLGWLLPSGQLPSMARQLDLWEQSGQLALGERRHETLEEAADILHRHLPEGSAPGLCWGDARPGNIIWRDWQCASVTDWEGASISPPELDVAWWIMFDRTMHEGSGVERLPGEPTREEQLAIYEEAAGRRVKDLLLHEIFAAYRYCVIVVQMANRFVDRGVLPADNEFWIKNPIVDILAELSDS